MGQCFTSFFDHVAEKYPVHMTLGLGLQREMAPCWSKVYRDSFKAFTATPLNNNALQQ